MTSQIRGNTHIIKLTRGEPILPALEAHARAHHIPFASVSGIGRVTKVRLATLDAQGEYAWQTLPGALELLSLSGNLAWDDETPGTPRYHLHATLGDDELQAWGGHFGDAIVAGVVEIILRVSPGAMIMRRALGEASFKTLDLRIKPK